MSVCDVYISKCDSEEVIQTTSVVCIYIYIWKSSHSYATFQLDIPIFGLAFYYGDEFINKLNTSAHLPTPMQVETI